MTRPLVVVLLDSRLPRQGTEIEGPTLFPQVEMSILSECWGKTAEKSIGYD